MIFIYVIIIMVIIMKKTIVDFDFKDKTVVLRCDLNVPVKNGKIIDDSKIVKSLKSINYIVSNGGKVVILSHFGKIKSESDFVNNSLDVVYKRLRELVSFDISFCSSLDFDVVKNSVFDVSYGNGILLENTRFYDIPNKLESDCSDILSMFYASLGDIFINDAFGTIHRGHASNCGVANYLDSGIGFLIMDEISNLSILDNPDRPFVVIMGGAKLSDKLGVISSLIEKVDYLLVGGAMSYTFLKAKGYNIGRCLYEDDYVSYCSLMLDKYGDKIVLPIDLYGSSEYSNDSLKRHVFVDLIDNDFMGLDLGDETISLFTSYLKDAKTIFWNGPVGVYEFSNYIEGSKKLLDFIGNIDAVSILGGGDLVSCANVLSCSSSFTYVSTGGGATLEYIVNKDLPGLVNIGEKDYE